MMASAVAIPFPDSMAHLLAGIECIETLIRLQIGRCRTAAKDQDPYRGLYISDAEIDSLLDQPFGASPYVVFTAASEAGQLIEAMRSQCAARQAEAEHNGIRLRLAELARKFGLNRWELDCLLICALPELDLRYERVYAYLQDDVTRKHATVDFVLGLLCDSFPQRLAARRHFGAYAPLFFWKLLERFEDSQGGRAPGPGHLLRPDERIIRWLLEGDEPDPQVASCSKLVVPASGCELSGGEAWERLSALVRPGADWPRIAYLYGPPGNAGHQIALALCRRHERPLLTIRLAEATRLDVAEFNALLRRVVREAILHDAIPCCEDFDVFLTDEKRPWLEAFAAELQLLKAPIFL
ncbi:MAG TPA: hypothetical protein VHB50_19065, partial [Bryobacteraceae bacterium]|nr:hypothetical protein [Bryobacteraceae bacterium]